MSLRVQHFVETRFSVWMRAGPPAFAQEWLDERLDLFRRFCLPSIAAQTTPAFTCLLFCDEATPPDVLAALRRHELELPTLSLALTRAERSPVEAVRQLVGADTDVLITTRLDSDDAIVDGYLEAVQDYAAPFHHCDLSSLLVNFPRGFRFDAETSIFYERRMPNSPFHSLFERPGRGPVDTVFRSAGTGRYRKGHGNHAMLHEHQVTHQDESMPAWLQVVHAGNVQNRISPADRPCDAEAATSCFTLSGVTT